MLLVSCGSPVEFKFQHQPDVVTCAGFDNELAKELLYSFESDIEAYYNFGRYEEGTELSLLYAYSNFAYTGARGEADFNSISSAHSLKLHEWLKNESDIYTKNNDTLRLNYAHPFVNCLIANIDNENIRNTIQNLVDANSMSSEIMASPIRQNYKDAMSDKDFAMYLSLDIYYKYLGLKSKPMSRPPANKHDGHDH